MCVRFACLYAVIPVCLCVCILGCPLTSDVPVRQYACVLVCKCSSVAVFLHNRVPVTAYLIQLSVIIVLIATMEWLR